MVEFSSALRTENLPTIFRDKTPRSIEEEAESLRKYEVQSDRVCFLAMLNRSVVGHLNLVCGDHPQVSHVAMLGMSVLGSSRESGIGSRLIRAGIGWAVAANLRKIQLEVMSNNPRAQALYERFGFEVEGERRQVVLVDEEYVDLIQMGLALSSEHRITSD